MAGVAEAVGEVLLGIGELQINRALGPGYHHRLGGTLDKVGEGCGSIGHGIGAVAEDKAVVGVVIFLNGGGHLQPVAGGDIGAVQVHQLEGVHLAEPPYAGDKAQHLLRGEQRFQAPGRALGGNGAAGGNHQNTVHCKSSLKRALASPRRGRAGEGNGVCLILQDYYSTQKQNSK